MIHRPITHSVRSARPVVMAQDYEAANDQAIFLGEEGRADPRSAKISSDVLADKFIIALGIGVILMLFGEALARWLLGGSI